MLLGLIVVAWLVRRSVVGFLYERRPRVWRAEWRSEDAPSQVEIARRIAEAQAESPRERPNRLQALGMGRCRRGHVS